MPRQQVSRQRKLAAIFGAAFLEIDKEANNRKEGIYTEVTVVLFYFYKLDTYLLY